MSSPFLPTFLCEVTWRATSDFKPVRVQRTGKPGWLSWVDCSEWLAVDSLRRPWKCTCPCHVYSQPFTHCDLGKGPLVLLYSLLTGIFPFNNLYYGFLIWFYLNKLKVGERGEYGSHGERIAAYMTDRQKQINWNKSTTNSPPVFLKEEKIIKKLQLPDTTFNSNWSETILISSKLQVLKLVIRLNSLGYKILST